MFSHRVLCLLGGLILCASGIVQAQAPGYPGKAQLVPCSKTTYIYKYPAGFRTYECCTPSDPQVVTSDTVDKKQAAGPVTRYLSEGAIASADRPATTCTDLSTLTLTERARRSASVFLGTCNRFSVYEHEICSCENSCADVNTFLCSCPGVPAGELPEIKPQDSLGSQPELIAESCTPCGRLSSCCEGF